MRTLLASWFSLEQIQATAGDLIAQDVTCDWLERAGHSYGVALAPPFHDGVKWCLVDPKAYSHVVFVCGPLGNGEPIPEFLERFDGSRLAGLNLTMLQSLDTISWPLVFATDDLTDQTLQQARDYCLTEGARVEAQVCRRPDIGMVQRVRDEFVSSLTGSHGMAED